MNWEHEIVENELYQDGVNDEKAMDSKKVQKPAIKEALGALYPAYTRLVDKVQDSITKHANEVY